MVEELLPHVGGGEVVELPPAEEVLQLPVGVEVWAQALVVVATGRFSVGST